MSKPNTAGMAATVAVTVVGAAGVWWLVTVGNPPVPPAPPPVHRTVRQGPSLEPPTSFTNTLNVRIRCGGQHIGFLIIDVDGKRLGYFNGNHHLVYSDPGTHQLSMYGSCYTTVAS